MFNNKLIEINQLLDILGYSDLRSVMTWASKNKVPIINIGKKTYCARKFIDLIIENQINSFVHENYENPSEVLAAVKANDNEGFSKLTDVPPTDEKVKTKFKQNKSGMSKAAKRMLDKLKSA